MLKIKFSKPIVFLDLETTGTDVEKDRIVSISMHKEHVPVFDWEELKTGFEVFESLVNPGTPIPPEASAVHGIYDEHVKDAAPFKDFANQIIEIITGSDIAGFNSNRFDIPLLYNELKRAGLTWDWKKSKFIDVCNIYKIKEPRTLEAAYLHYVGKPMEGAHDAGKDVNATIEVFNKQIEAYADLQGMNVSQLAHFSNFEVEIIDITGKFVKGKDGFIHYGFGKHIGKRCIDEMNYLNWMLREDFPPEVKEIATNIRYKGWK